MTDPCEALREKVMQLGKKLNQSSPANYKWPEKSFLTKEDIHKLREEIDKVHEIDEEFKKAVIELANCVKNIPC